jgi:hypothetical protein
MRRLRNFGRLGGARRRLLLEAALFELGARLALRWLPYPKLVWLLERPARRPEIEGVARARLRCEVSWAVGTAGRHLPGETVCFPRAIAAHAMLRRRGVSATLHYGAARLPERGLTTHAWVNDGAVGVVGHRVANEYHLLASYPGTV